VLLLAAAWPLANPTHAQLRFSDFPQVFDGTVDGVRSVVTADLDGDGDLDVLSASAGDDKIAFYRNDGSGTFGAQEIISDQADVGTSAFAADLDGDGDQDVLSASANDNTIALYRNDGTGTFAPQEVVSTTITGVSSIIAADFDGDNDLDILAAALFGDVIGLFRNDGSGVFGAEETITAFAGEVTSIHATDIDGDGDQDALFSFFNDDTITLYRNDGSGSFGAKEIITSNANGAASVYAADLDGDGDQDVLSASQTDDKVAFYLNDGSGTFGSQEIISTSADAAVSVYAADLDGDGDQDVLSASFADNTVSLYLNEGNGSFSAEQTISTDAGGALVARSADLNGDGDQDVVYGRATAVEAVSNLTPPLRLDVPETAFPGEMFTVDVVVGSDDGVLVIDDPEILGASFALEYSAGVLETPDADNIVAGPFLEPTSSDPNPLFDLTLQPEESRIAIGATRKRSLTYPFVTEPVTLAQITVQVAADAPIGETIDFAFRDFLAIDIGSEPIPLVGIDASVEIVEQGVVVWPGDADNSGAANSSDIAVEAADLLPIGLCFGVTGPARPGDFNIQWDPQNATTFDFPTDASDPCQEGAAGPAFTDPAYADGTGDGVIDARDVLPIGANFGLARTQTGSGDPRAVRLAATPVQPMPNAQAPSAASIRLPAPDKGATYPVTLALGEPAQGLFGTAARLRLPVGRYEIDAVEAGALLDDGNLLSISNYDAATGVLEIAFTRKRGAAPAAGEGDIAQITLRATQSASAPATIHLDEIVASQMGQGTATVTAPQIGSPVALPDVPEVFALQAPYPNPASRRATLAYQLPEATDVRMTLYDALGRTVAVLVDRRLEAGSYEHVLSTSDLATGLYFYRVDAGSHTATRKLTVVR
jgi:hypothetical protein